jgi:hypothetical protein
MVLDGTNPSTGIDDSIKQTDPWADEQRPNQGCQNAQADFYSTPAKFIFFFDGFKDNIA